MLAPAPVRSIDALLADDPGALDDSELKANLSDFAVARSRLDAAEAATIAEFDQRCAFVSDGMTDTRAWLAQHTGVSRGTAGSRLWLAKRLRQLPLMLAALADAKVTDGHARALARCINPRTTVALARDEELLVANATDLAVDEFSQLLDHWMLINDPNGRDPEHHTPSVLHLAPLLEGRMRIDGDFDLQDAVELRAEIEAIYDELWHHDQAAPDTDPLKHRTRSERTAAALIEAMRRSSAAGDRDDDPDEPATRCRPRPRQPLIIAVVDIEPLSRSIIGPARLDDGTPIPPEVLEQWACDSPIGRVLMHGKSLPLDVGTLTYTATSGQRRALIARDRGCIVPGCNRKPRWCEAHHVEPYPAGPTNIANLVLLCKRHHKQVHTNIIQLLRGEPPGRWIVTDRYGTPLRERPPPTLAA